MFVHLTFISSSQITVYVPTLELFLEWDLTNSFLQKSSYIMKIQKCIKLNKLKL